MWAGGGGLGRGGGGGLGYGGVTHLKYTEGRLCAGRSDLDYGRSG